METNYIFIIIIAFIIIALLLYYFNIPSNPSNPSVISKLKPRYDDYFDEGVINQINNPYGNPLPYEDGSEVRSSIPPIKYLPEDSVAKLYRGTSQTDENLFFNRIPDPTLIARPVFWPEDPRPDIVSDQANCAYRGCF